MRFERREGALGARQRRRQRRGATSLFCALISLSPSAMAALAADCDGDACVTVPEVVSAVRIALNRAPLERCPAADANSDGRVRVAELIEAVRAGTQPCAAQHPATCPWVETLDAPIQAFLLAGQSNMVGLYDFATFPPDMVVPHERVLQFNREWETLVPSTTLGPEVEFARTIAAACPGSRIGVVKRAIAATGINAWLRDWSFAAAELTGNGSIGPLYPWLIDAARSAADHAAIEWRGIVWVQGHSDKPALITAQSYGENLADFAAALREDLGVPELHFVYHGIRNGAEPDEFEDTSPTAPFLTPPYHRLVEDQKWQAQTAIANATLVILRDIPTFDFVHFTPEGVRSAGRLLAEGFLSAELDRR